MRLKSIEMQGFKSFPQKTKINFNSGVTAIIGPNGSGKSNISDAVRWVLGEMSLKSLRGKKMEDVIFNGAGNIAPSNYTSVSLTLDTEEEFHNAQSLRIEQTIEDPEAGADTKNVGESMSLGDNKEIVITRKYYRSGESEYYINKTPVRLKDIYNIFYDTGIGREGYSVIGQGKISEVLSQKGDERRSIFEEAAGISKIRHKKVEAERKLESTEANLLRINDILGEVSGRIGPLAKEAQNAKEYLTLSEEKKGLEITLWLDRIDQIKTELSQVTVQYNMAKHEYEQSEQAVDRLEKEIDDTYDHGYEISKLAAETEKKLMEAINKRGELQAKNAVYETDIRHFTKVIEDNKDKISQIDSQIKIETEQLDNQDRELVTATTEFDVFSKNADAEYEQYEAIRSKVVSNRQEYENVSEEYQRIQDSSLDYKTHQTKIDTEILMSEEAIKQASDRVSESKQRINDLAVQKDQAALKVKEYEDKIAEIFNIKTQLEQKLQQYDQLITESDKKINQTATEQTVDNQRLKQLVRMEELFEGYSDSVRRIMTEANKGTISVNGTPVKVHGTLSSLISTKGDHVIALETALAGSAQFIVVEDEEDAKSGISYLKANKGGRATFLPLTTVMGRKCDVEDIKDLPGYIGIASELAEYDNKYTNVITNVLGRTVIATDLESAVTIAKKNNFRTRIVTSDGQVINAGGSFTGGSSAQKVGLLTRSVDIKNLQKAIDKRETLITKQAKEHRELIESREKTKALFLQSEGEIRETEALQKDISTGHNALSVRLEEERTRLAEHERQESESLSKVETLKTHKLDHVNTIRQDEEKLMDLKTKREECLASLRSAVSEEEAFGEAVNKTRQALFEKRSALHTLREKIERTKDKLQEYRITLVELQRQTEQTESTIDLRTSDIQKQGLDMESIALEIKLHEDELKKMTYGKENIDKEINTQRDKLKSLQSDKDDMFRRHMTLESRQSKLNDSFEDITNKLWDGYELTYSSAVKHRLPSEQMDKATTRLNTLKSKIRSMGVINVNAVEEYSREKERFDFLTTQTEDLKKSGRSLDQAISRLNSEMKQTFLDVFDKINTEFGAVFTQLFGGGSAYLELSDPEYPLDCGIEIIIKPPGKSVRNISLLSGGEQSFAAIALYLALQKVNPAPFCIFDEIESALDDVNLVKFADYIRQNSESTQYILITHRRGTMERADTLYGITMRQKGISDYIELNMPRLEENLKEYISE